MNIVRKGFNPFIALFGADISSAEDCIDFVGCDHFFILGRDFRTSLRDVKITQDKGELTHLLFFSHYVDLVP